MPHWDWDSKRVYCILVKKTEKKTEGQNCYRVALRLKNAAE